MNQNIEGEDPAPQKPFKNKDLTSKTALEPAPLKQLPLDLGIEIERNVAGIEMGVLENGIPYLTQRGLAEMSGAARSTIFEISKEWEESYDDVIQPGTRIGFLKGYLFKSGYDAPALYIQVMKDNSPHYAYPDLVCMAIIEFFAFESQKNKQKGSCKL